MLTYADVCWRMLTYAGVCLRMLTYAAGENPLEGVMRIKPDLVSRMLTYADVFWRMLAYAAGENPPEGVKRIKPDLVAPGAYLVAANSRGDPGAKAEALSYAMKALNCALIQP